MVAATRQLHVVLDIAGRRVDLDPDDARRLRDLAAASAGNSSVARDLSLLLDRALDLRQVVALRRSEAMTLAQLARRIDSPTLAPQMTAQAA